ncbi:MAG TPA: NAD-dependent epimerase/dehydratase family protein [Stellaceae bacterium]|nr:NAD-dependent epimerase/dehydratase family protein [Stellaceae bacterium]
MSAASRPVLITGGAGFVGANLADRLLAMGRPVRLYDTLARPGSERNLRALRAKYGFRVAFEPGDVRSAAQLCRAVADVGTVFHLAAQVAVTTSLAEPRADFDVNAAGTLNLLEALRRCGREVRLVFTSTNKVYGALDDLALVALPKRYRPERDLAGIDETRPLNFHSPYGCSKGAADQYVLDYARSYGLAALVFRMSCIYGPYQHGTEDQGWVAHFLIRALEEQPITIYGDGRQVRDLLYIDDLVAAFLLAERALPDLAGEAFNIGGGPANTTSLVELIETIARRRGGEPPLAFADWRPGDQRWYVSDIGKFARATGWRPRVGVEEGIARLHAWLERRLPRSRGAARDLAGGRDGRAPATMRVAAQ